jgi:uncharacterized protein (UPF0335 family)
LTDINTKGEGHNSANAENETSGHINAAAERLRSFVERVERMEEEKATLMEDIKEIFSEAKGEGYDVKILKRCIKERKRDKADRQEEEAIYTVYAEQLNLL